MLSDMNIATRGSIGLLGTLLGLAMILLAPFPVNLVGLVFVVIGLIYSVSVIRDVSSEKDDEKP